MTTEVATKAKMGRPTRRTQKVEEELVARLIEGQTLSDICRDDHMPSYQSVWDWTQADSDFSEMIKRARRIGTHAMADECIRIADDGTNDWMEKRDKDGRITGYDINGEHVQRSKLRIETRMKLIGRWNDRDYGDKMTHKGDPDAPLVEDNSPRQLAIAVAFILQEARAKGSNPQQQAIAKD